MQLQIIKETLYISCTYVFNANIYLNILLCVEFLQIISVAAVLTLSASECCRNPCKRSEELFHDDWINSLLFKTFPNFKGKVSASAKVNCAKLSRT